MDISSNIAKGGKGIFEGYNSVSELCFSVNLFSDSVSVSKKESETDTDD